MFRVFRGSLLSLTINTDPRNTRNERPILSRPPAIARHKIIDDKRVRTWTLYCRNRRRFNFYRLVFTALFPLPLGGVRGGPATPLTLCALREASTFMSELLPSSWCGCELTLPSENKTKTCLKPSPNPSQREGSTYLYNHDAPPLTLPRGAGI